MQCSAVRDSAMQVATALHTLAVAAEGRAMQCSAGGHSAPIPATAADCPAAQCGAWGVTAPRHLSYPCSSCRRMCSAMQAATAPRHLAAAQTAAEGRATGHSTLHLAAARKVCGVAQYGWASEQHVDVEGVKQLLCLHLDSILATPLTLEQTQQHLLQQQQQ